MPKISGLPVTTTPTGADTLPIVQSGTTKQTTFAKLPISDAVTTALALKADANNTTLTGTTTINGTLTGAGVTKAAVGLGNVDNTSDVNKPVSTAQQTALNQKPSRNLLHNGNFIINQRAVSGTVTLAAGAYGHDRWKAGAGGATYTFAASGNSFIITLTAGSLMQVVEDKDVDGGVYTLSNQGTAQARIAINGAATSGAYAATPLTTASTTGNQTITVEFTTGTIDRVQLESGTLATPFARRPYATELAVAQRYYWRFNGASGGNTVLGTGLVENSTTSVFMSWRFPVTMRIAPTVTTTGTIQIYDGSTITSISGSTLFDTVDGISRQYTVSPALTAGRGCVFLIRANAFVEHSADL